jgi:hypothetical protein
VLGNLAGTGEAEVADGDAEALGRGNRLMRDLKRTADARQESELDRWAVPARLSEKETRCKLQ